MLEIRREQLAAFDAALRARHVASVAAFLRDQMGRPSAAMSDDELNALIERGLDAAESRGVVGRWDQARFVALALCLGEDFETAPEHTWAQGVLAREDLTPTQKMDWLERHCLRARLREEG